MSTLHSFNSKNGQWTGVDTETPPVDDVLLGIKDAPAGAAGMSAGKGVATTGLFAKGTMYLLAGGLFFVAIVIGGVVGGLAATGQFSNASSSDTTTANTTQVPSPQPSFVPSLTPSKSPSGSPTVRPSAVPSVSPSSSRPSQSPTTSKPSNAPSLTPTTSRPSTNPTTSRPSSSPTTERPTASPTTSRPTSSPTTSRPSSSPVTSKPSASPTTSKPTTSPTAAPTYQNCPSKWIDFRTFAGGQVSVDCLNFALDSISRVTDCARPPTISRFDSDSGLLIPLREGQGDGLDITFSQPVRKVTFLHYANGPNGGLCFDISYMAVTYDADGNVLSAANYSCYCANPGACEVNYGSPISKLSFPRVPRGGWIVGFQYTPVTC